MVWQLDKISVVWESSHKTLLEYDWLTFIAAYSIEQAANSIFECQYEFECPTISAHTYTGLCRKTHISNELGELELVNQFKEASLLGFDSPGPRRPGTCSSI